MQLHAADVFQLSVVQKHVLSPLPASACKLARAMAAHARQCDMHGYCAMGSSQPACIAWERCPVIFPDFYQILLDLDLNFSSICCR